VTPHQMTGPGSIPTKAKCPECWRVFDLTDGQDADEWFYGHDCEGQDEDGPPPDINVEGQPEFNGAFR